MAVGVAGGLGGRFKGPVVTSVRSVPPGEEAYRTLFDLSACLPVPGDAALRAEVGEATLPAAALGDKEAPPFGDSIRGASCSCLWSSLGAASGAGEETSPTEVRSSLGAALRAASGAGEELPWSCLSISSLPAAKVSAFAMSAGAIVAVLEEAFTEGCST